MKTTAIEDAAYGWRQKLQPNLRTTPFCSRPFAIRQVDRTGDPTTITIT